MSVLIWPWLLVLEVILQKLKIKNNNLKSKNQNHELMRQRLQRRNTKTFSEDWKLKRRTLSTQFLNLCFIYSVVLRTSSTYCQQSIFANQEMEMDMEKKNTYVFYLSK
jgi:hypothetical protein